MALHQGAVADGLSGEWTLTMDPDFRGNREVVVCLLNQSGIKITIQCDNGSGAAGARMAGNVNGQTVTWGFPPPAGQKLPFARWIGTVDQSLKRIKGTWHLSIIDEDLKGNFTAAKR
jgi:hypothetical protein